jgi:hypothetical protein
MARISVQGLNDKIVADFIGKVELKYGKKHTVLGIEVQKALKFYMDNGMLDEDVC